jgi:hypothetical protein
MFVLKPYVWPRWIVKDGEQFEFVQSKPTGLVYANDRSVIVISREEAKSLASETSA